MSLKKKKLAQYWSKDPRIWLRVYAQVLNMHLELNNKVHVVLKWDISLVYKHTHTHVPPAEVLGKKWFLLEMEVVNRHCTSRHGWKEAREMAQRGKANVLNMDMVDNGMYTDVISSHFQSVSIMIKRLWGRLLLHNHEHKKNHFKHIVKV